MAEQRIPTSARVLISISPEQMTQIYRVVREHHHLVRGRKIKYIDTVFDNRTGDIGYVAFRGWGAEPKRVFTVTNRFDTDRVDLFREIVDWLESGRETEEPTHDGN